MQFSKPDPHRRSSRITGKHARRFLVVGVALGLGTLLLVGSAGANAMFTPVVRAGQPTVTIEPPPIEIRPTPNPVPTPTSIPAKPQASPTASPTPTGKKTPKSSGKFTAAGLNIPAAGSSGKKRSYLVRVETSTRLKAEATGKRVGQVLNDPRSWGGDGSVRFAQVSQVDKAAFTITLAAAPTITKSCGKPSVGVCVADQGIWVDAAWWKTGPASFDEPNQWQAYLVNHAVGRYLGQAKARCPGSKRLAPVMMDQSGNLKGCRANPWVFPG